MFQASLLKLALRSTSIRPLFSLNYFAFSSSNNQTLLMEQVESKIFEILKSASKCDHSKLSRQATFEQLGFDSLDSVELVVAMEENLGLDIPNEEA